MKIFLITFFSLIAFSDQAFAHDSLNVCQLLKRPKPGSILLLKGVVVGGFEGTRFIVPSDCLNARIIIRQTKYFEMTEINKNTGIWYLGASKKDESKGFSKFYQADFNIKVKFTSKLTGMNVAEIVGYKNERILKLPKHFGYEM